mgnify:CR=1 FL=1
MNLEQETRYILKKYGTSANKSLGQNFLKDKGVLAKIIDSVDVKEDDLIITRQICFDDDFINLKDKKIIKNIKFYWEQQVPVRQ